MGEPVETKRLVECGSQKGKFVGLLTSGGDSQGMNAALRAAVRMGIYLGCRVFFIRDGFEGLILGGDYITEAYWTSVSGIIMKGGTIIGSHVSKEFRERSGRLKAAKNLVKANITSLVVIGGDGSFAGASALYQEWQSLLDELFDSKEIFDDERSSCSSLRIAALPGSITNDVCGIHMTIGTDTALHRVVEAIDAIVSTAFSHQRTFIMEIMGGRQCGYLGLVASLMTEADYVFIPEMPPPVGWEEQMCRKLEKSRSRGIRLNIIIITDGSTDRNGDPITANMVKGVVETRLNQDARVTVLGHVQRGGSPSVYDRILASRLGAEAILALVVDKSETKANAIAIDNNETVRIPLLKCVNETKALAQALRDKNWDLAFQMRGPGFARNYNTYRILTSLSPPSKSIADIAHSEYVVGIVNIGAPACGMNAATYSFVRNCICRGITVYGIQNGLDGLISGQVVKMGWSDVANWVSQGGSMLGTKRTLLKGHVNQIAGRIKEFGIQAMLAVGGFEAYLTGLQFTKFQKTHPELCIPFVVIPATISNNVPGTDLCLGSDTSLNEIIKICDLIRQSAEGLSKRVFIIETMGGFCGYLATLAGIACGADSSYIFEEKFAIKDLTQDVNHMISKMERGVIRGLIIRNEKCNDNYSSDFICRLFSEEGRGTFSARMNVLGHMQQAGSPSPCDRKIATKVAALSLDYIINLLQQHVQADGSINVSTPDSVVMMGIHPPSYKFTPLVDLVAGTDFEHHIPIDQWWLKLRPLARVISKHITAYDDERAIVITGASRTFMTFI